MQHTYSLLLSKYAVAVSNQHTTIGYRGQGGGPHRGQSMLAKTTSMKIDPVRVAVRLYFKPPLNND